jgi:hypothetical protein
LIKNPIKFLVPYLVALLSVTTFNDKVQAADTYNYLRNYYSGLYLNSQGYPYPLKTLNMWYKYPGDPEQAFIDIGCDRARYCIKIQQGKNDTPPNQSPTSIVSIGYCLNLDYLQVNRPVTLFYCYPNDPLQAFETVPATQWNGVYNAEYVRIKLRNQPYCLEPQSSAVGSLVILTYCGSGVTITPPGSIGGNTRQLWKKEFNNQNSF